MLKKKRSYLLVLLILLIGCTGENPLDPVIKEVEVKKYIDYEEFGDIIGDWQDASAGGFYTITTNAYIDYYPGAFGYTLEAEIVEIKAKKNYFIIHITNHSEDWGTNQIGNYTKIHWRNYESYSVSKAEVEFSQHYPQALSLSEAQTQSTAGMMFAVFTNID